MRDTRRTIQAFLSLLRDVEHEPDLTSMIIQLAATTPAILFIYDLTSQRAIFLNRRIYDVMGITPQDDDPVESDLLTRRMHPDDAATFPLNLKWFDTAGDDDILQMECRLRHEDGGYRWISIRCVVCKRDAAGRVLQMMASAHDITDSRRTQQLLEESEARLQVALENAGLALWDWDILVDEVHFDSHWERIVGYSTAELQQIYAEGRTLVHPEDQARFDAVLQSQLLDDALPYDLEYRMQHKTGIWIWVHLHGTVLNRDLNDKPTRMIGTIQDVTSRRVAEESQKLLQEQLFESQKLEGLGRLAGGVAHDFNNLLTAILGYTELSLMTLPAESEVRPFLNNVTAAGQRAAELTRQLLMYARRQMVEFTILDINRVIMEIDPLLRRTIGEQYELVTILADDACCVNANLGQIEQVLTNLVVNARDAMPEGGRIVIETGIVELDDEYTSRHIGVAPGEYVLFSVSDSGVGMTAEVRNRIFEPFFTTKEAGRGTGLGLATCYGIVKQSHGNIWVYSEPGQGSAFKVYLPRVHELPNTIPASSPDGLPVGTETILLVDDEPMVRDIAARSLRMQGYRVLEAGNGVEALHKQAEWPGEIDLLITDVVMPLLGGKELAHRLKSIRPGVKVLYMSGYTQNVVLKQGALQPGLAMLTKPFTAASMAQKVRQVLANPANAEEGQA